MDADVDEDFNFTKGNKSSMQKSAQQSTHGGKSALYTVEDDVPFKKGNKRYEAASKDNFDSVVS